MNKVFITGVTGQDGSLMVDYLLKNTDNQIFGGVRRLSVKNYENISHIKNKRFSLIDYDASDPISIEDTIRKIEPDYIINFAANSFVGNSWEMPHNHFQVNTISVVYLLETIRKFIPNCRFYQASTSEMFGNVLYSPQDENHPLVPCSPYGVSKSAAYLYVKMYRQSYGIYAVNGISFNHGSIRRGKEFIERKISCGVANIYHNLSLSKNPEKTIIPLEVGNIYSERDWSHANDIIDGVWKILNQDTYNKEIKNKIDEKIRMDNILRVVTQEKDLREIIVNNIKDYVIASNKTYSIKFLIEEAFKVLKIYGKWIGEKENEQFILTKYCKEDFSDKNIVLVKINPEFYRPLDVNHLCGNSTAIRNDLDWNPKYDIYSFIKELVIHDAKNY